MLSLTETAVRIALLGFGSVGRAFARFLAQARSAKGLKLAIQGVADRSGGVWIRDETELAGLILSKEQGRSLKDEAGPLPVFSLNRFVDSARDQGVGVVVECLPTRLSGGEPAISWLERLLASGISAVTVDKGTLVHGFDRLRDAAGYGETRLIFNGATGVRAPAGIQAGSVVEIEGVLNGTTNFILNSMLSSGLSLKEALVEARGRGIAEPDPSLDLQGWDTACKLWILAKHWMGASADFASISCAGLDARTPDMVDEATRTGRTVRLIGHARHSQQGIRLWVAPEIVRRDSVFFDLPGASKAAVLRTREGRELFATGISGIPMLCETILSDVQLASSSD